MESFLEKTVKLLCEKYKDDISELCIVLPNRRAGLFLKTHFSNQLQKTFWSPEIYATEDFIGLLAGGEIADNVTLLFELYETAKAVNADEAGSFDEFSKWGQILISDFNEIDRYLVDAEQLFGNLKDIKELESWSLNSEDNLTDFQKQYLNFWQQLGDYYTDFTKRLQSKHLLYQGLAYKVVAGDVLTMVEKHSWKKIIFAGFNALNKAEEYIIETLLVSGKADVIWDTDSYYVNDTKQEAGRFIRKYNNYNGFKHSAGNVKVIDENLLSTENKHITVIGAAKNVAQAKVAGNLVSELQQKDPTLQKTALVLADENLLFPVLHSLPQGLEDINVTMGYPLKNTPVSGYFELVFDMHLNAIKLQQGKEKYSFYHQDLLKFLNHPYTAVLLFNKKYSSSVKPIVSSIHDRNIVFAALSTLKKIIDEKQPQAAKALLPVLEHWRSPADAIACVYYLIEQLKNAIVASEGDNAKTIANLELEYLFAFTKIIKRIEALNSDYPEGISDLKTLQNVVKQIVRSTTLPFYGEPLMGLQLMGMLETRTLDFENVILLSCNEDILPSGKSTNSFIPYELKRYFGLPTYSDKDSIFAYHFYRLLQRAKTVFLVYNTESDALGSGEKSRFLTQLLYELPKVNSHALIEEKLVNIPATTGNDAPHISIQKSEEVQKKLQSIAEYGISPSALNRYRNCSLQFYFHAIAGLREVDEVAETIGADVLGNVVHEVLEKLYTPFVGKKITEAAVKEFKEKAESLAIEAFEKEYSKSEISYGKNLLTIKVALKFLTNFFEAEKQFLNETEKAGKPMIIKALEQELESAVSVGDKKIRLYGKADRIDSVGAITRIVDYKTGVADDKELKVEEWEAIRTDSNLAKSFQLLMYAWMYQKMNPAITTNIQSGIITFRQLSAGLKPVRIEKSESLNAELLADFEAQLINILYEMFDSSVDFKQTDNHDNCTYCAFKGVCNRQ